VAVYLAPDPINSTQFQPGGNTPASGALLFCYQKGTSTKMNSYSDPTASTANTNPIVLDSGGNPPQEIWIASTATFVLAPSNDTDPPSSPYRTWNDIPGINNVTSNAASEWVTGSTAAFVGVTAFSVAGDQTALYTLGRRIKATVTGGDKFGVITSSAFGGANTAVGVTLDSGTLNAGLSAVYYGLLSTPNGSVPWSQITSSGINVTASAITASAISALGPITFSSAAHNDSQTTVTSSANPNIWTGGNIINFTGTTTVSSFANAPQAGASRTLLIAGATSVTFATSSALKIGGGASTYIASIGDRVDVIATSTSTFSLYSTPLVLRGSWLPSIGGTATYSGRSGRWMKINDMVIVTGTMIVNTIGTGSSTTISGLPFTLAAGASGFATDWSSTLTAVTFLSVEGSGGTTNLVTVGATAATTATVLMPTFQNGTFLMFGMTYFTT
jgi:hypothetical protein